MQQVKVTYLDGEAVEVKIIPADMMRYERSAHYHPDRAMTGLMYSAWASLTRTRSMRSDAQGRNLSFDAWAAEVGDVDPIEERADADPTRPDRSPESASD